MVQTLAAWAATLSCHSHSACFRISVGRERRVDEFVGKTDAKTDRDQDKLSLWLAEIGLPLPLPPLWPQSSLHTRPNNCKRAKKWSQCVGEGATHTRPNFSIISSSSFCQILLMSLLVGGREMHPVLESIIPSLQILAVPKYSAQAEGVISRISLFLQKDCCFFEMLLARNIKVKWQTSITQFPVKWPCVTKQIMRVVCQEQRWM